MPKIILTIGAPASGKSTWADQETKKTGAVNLNRDNFRRALFHFKSYSEYKFKSWQEYMVTQSIKKAADEAVAMKRDIIVSDTNLNLEVRNAWKEWAKKNGYEYHELLFYAELDVLLKRDAMRDGGVGPQVITRMHESFVDQFGTVFGPRYEPDTSKPNAIIFDIDGTLANMDGVRTPFQFDKVGLDTPKFRVIQLAQMYKKAGYKIIVLSGRDDVCQPQTEEWLKKWEVPFDELHMRPVEDKRRDSYIKAQIFQEKLVPKYNILLAVDDRDQIVNLWRDLGVECWQVQRGTF